MRKMRRLRSSWACAKYHPGLCSPFVHAVVSNDSVSGYGRPGSECADAQSHLGLRCLHMPEDTCSHDVAHIIVNTMINKAEGLLVSPLRPLFNGRLVTAHPRSVVFARFPPSPETINSNIGAFKNAFGGGWVRQRCRVSCVTGESNKLIAGQSLLSLQQVRVERESFYFFTFIHFLFSPLFLSFISSTISCISLPPFSGRRH